MTAVTLDDTRTVLAAAQKLTGQCVDKARELTKNGKAIDDHQPVSERVAYASTEATAAKELLEFVAGNDRADDHLKQIAAAGVAELAVAARDRLWPVLEDLGLTDADMDAAYSSEVKALIRKAMHESALREIGQVVADRKGKNSVPLDEMLEQVRDNVRAFADKEVAPHAEHIHRSDALIPESFIEQMGELGFFGLSIPEAFGGHEMGNLAMILTTEELSRASLAAAGSLITRPEILSKAIVKGGTDEQKKKWLPPIAAGEIMVGISVTEPNVGSDVASLTCAAKRATVDGVDGWLINGPKSWCTFAGRANALAMLLRTDPDLSKGAKGLSLFIVPKDSFEGHEFEMVQPSGGKMSGKADPTPGYRGMHSYTLSLEDYFVPAENLVGGEDGLNKGFYLQMAGFAAGRLQTGGRATGLAQAALERTAEYACERVQFKKPIIEFGLTQYSLGKMAVKLAAARAITYAAAEAMDQDERAAAPLAAQAKLYACDVAVETTQLGQQIHGGWGYAEEYPISRYVVDATVLPIFEGVKPILELKVVARALFA